MKKVASAGSAEYTKIVIAPARATGCKALLTVVTINASALIVFSFVTMAVWALGIVGAPSEIKPQIVDNFFDSLFRAEGWVVGCSAAIVEVFIWVFFFILATRFGIRRGYEHGVAWIVLGTTVTAFPTALVRFALMPTAMPVPAKAYTYGALFFSHLAGAIVVLLAFWIVLRRQIEPDGSEARRSLAQ